MNIEALGVMQGRLLPKYEGRYQAHPLGYWQNEFKIAADLGLSCIEFILDFNDSDLNPLLSKRGIADILEQINSTGVKVISICADYFMEAPLHSVENSVSELSKGVLIELLNNSKALGVKDIVIPCVDQSALDGEEAMSRLIVALASIIPVAERNDINLSLETDLDPRNFKLLLDRLPSKNVTVNYDTGNSSSLGYDPVEEFKSYGKRISDIHIKDRKLGGGSVILGTGDTNFPAFFEALKLIDFSGPFIMQSFRDNEGLEIFKNQLDWFKNYYSKS